MSAPPAIFNLLLILSFCVALSKTSPQWNDNYSFNGNNDRVTPSNELRENGQPFKGKARRLTQPKGSSQWNRRYSFELKEKQQPPLLKNFPKGTNNFFPPTPSKTHSKTDKIFPQWNNDYFVKGKPELKNLLEESEKYKCGLCRLLSDKSVFPLDHLWSSDSKFPFLAILEGALLFGEAIERMKTILTEHCEKNCGQSIYTNDDDEYVEYYDGTYSESGRDNTKKDFDSYGGFSNAGGAWRGAERIKNQALGDFRRGKQKFRATRSLDSLRENENATDTTSTSQPLTTQTKPTPTAATIAATTAAPTAAQTEPQTPLKQTQMSTTTGRTSTEATAQLGAVQSGALSTAKPKTAWKSPNPATQTQSDDLASALLKLLQQKMAETFSQTSEQDDLIECAVTALWKELGLPVQRRKPCSSLSAILLQPFLSAVGKAVRDFDFDDKSWSDRLPLSLLGNLLGLSFGKSNDNDYDDYNYSGSNLLSLLFGG